jgi:hypothetical protein
MKSAGAWVLPPLLSLVASGFDFWNLSLLFDCSRNAVEALFK